MNNHKYTVITGASRGLGKALAETCAEQGMHLILIALPDEGTFILAEELKKKFNVDTVAYEADLTNQEELEKLSLWINDNYDVNMLINNAGVGGCKPFHEVSSAYLDNVILLNIRSLVLFTHNLLPNLQKQNKSYILNVASMASFGPMPYKTVYPASKSFVYSFSRGLNYELKGTNIFVSVVHPGGMATNPDASQRINQHGKLIKSTILSTKRVSEICIRQLLKENAVIIPGFMNKISWLLIKTSPFWLRMYIIKKSLLKEIESDNNS